MSRAKVGSGAAAVLGVAAGWVGKCASCRFSADSDLVGRSGMLCCRTAKKGALPASVRAHWTCEFYEYEPGAAS